MAGSPAQLDSREGAATLHPVRAWLRQVLPPSWVDALERQAREWGLIPDRPGEKPIPETVFEPPARPPVTTVSLAASPVRSNLHNRRRRMTRPVPTSPQRPPLDLSGPRPRALLWIDGVGCWLVCFGEEATLGGPGVPGDESDVPLLADLSRQHATISRSGDSYLLRAHAEASVAGRAVRELDALRDGYHIELGRGVTLRFRQPSPLSGTAVLDFVSGHRPARRIDGVVLMESTCLLGPGGDSHIACPLWDQTVILFRREGGLWCKSREAVTVDRRIAPESGAPLGDGSVVAGGEADVRFRVERVPP